MAGETVLVVHNRYRERGGEESAYEAESRMLEEFGHRVIRYERDSRDTAGAGGLALATRSVWSVADYREIGRIVREEEIDLVHFHNTFPLISPSAHHAARKAGAAVVQTLHNFRLLCPGGLFLRDGKPCESCLGQPVPWPSVIHRCYRGSMAATAVVSGMITAHRAVGTWRDKVDAFIALSRFARERFVSGGLPADRIFVSANTPGIDSESDPARLTSLDTEQTAGAVDHRADRPYFLYVGRLETEKGVGVLLDAWAAMAEEIDLRIVGDGALRDRVAETAEGDDRISWLGQAPRSEVLNQMRGGYALVFPSLCYENYPGVLAEAQASGLPVVASALGSGAEMVTDGGFGELFEAGDVAALAAAVRALSGDTDRRAALARRARVHFEDTLTTEHSYARLSNIYQHALARRHGRAHATG